MHGMFNKPDSFCFRKPFKERKNASDHDNLINHFVSRAQTFLGALGFVADFKWVECELK